MRWNAFVLCVLMTTAANSQSLQLVAPAHGSNGAAMILRGVLGLVPPITSLFTEQSAGCVVNAPYFAVGDSESVTRFPDGNRIIQTTSVRYYRDGQGRTRMERAMFGSDNLVTVMVNDNVSGQYYMLQPQMKMAQVFKTAIPGPAETHQPPVPAPEKGLQLSLSGGGLASKTPPTNASLGQKELEGLTTTGTRWEQTFAAGTVGNDKPITITVEQWYSPDLGVVVFATQRTSTGAEMTYRLHNITRSEPDSALFTIPADYTRHEGGGPMTVTAVRKD